MWPPRGTEPEPNSRDHPVPPWLWALRLLAFLSTALAAAVPIIAAFWLVVFLLSVAAFFLYVITFGGVHFDLDHVSTLVARSAGLIFVLYLLALFPLAALLLKTTAKVAAWTFGTSSTLLLGAWLFDPDLLSLLGSVFAF
ncbi:hypothetical protein MF271_13965 [Deinococcus sp. KNUC1210]|uniref:hypothetical protein n=1 Tax=Deinococcus sp. KNUC1210 TaxID=2917691 RepID=UPI001EF07AC9|nr:hypothetical protein [Deinococcus sp. KNUC1210]ULH15053.1 hypothetical protein MF271_13965 [Deinococcus sp. KNUC1210]